MDHTQLINKIYDEATAYARDRGWVDSAWTCDVKIDASPRRTRSWGGQRGRRPFISLAVRPHLNGTLVEYSSFRDDPEIGTVTGSVEKALAALTVHELAHAIQYSGNKDAIAGNSLEAKQDTGGHGVLWRKIYRALRKNFVNNKEWPLLGVGSYRDDDGWSSDYYASCTFAHLRAPSRTEARQLAFEMFKRGCTASEIIRHLVAKSMKKTTASTYVYEVKSAYSF